MEIIHYEREAVMRAFQVHRFLGFIGLSMLTVLLGCAGEEPPAPKEENSSQKQVSTEQPPRANSPQPSETPVEPQEVPHAWETPEAVLAEAIRLLEAKEYEKFGRTLLPADQQQYVRSFAAQMEDDPSSAAETLKIFQQGQKTLPTTVTPNQVEYHVLLKKQAGERTEGFVKLQRSETGWLIDEFGRNTTTGEPVEGQGSETPVQQKLKTIGIAISNYEQHKKVFPRNIRDKEGQPLLSWRVELLPLLGQRELYNQFHLDEPWDSPHNLKLLEQVPEIYMASRADEDGTTPFLAPEGDGTILGSSNEIGTSHLIDGAHNTILLLRCDYSIPWTKPSDHEFSAEDPGAGFLATRSGAPNDALFADSSLQVIEETITSNKLLELFRFNDNAPQEE